MMKKMIVLCLVALYLLAAPVFAAPPVKYTVTDEAYTIDGVCTPVIVEVTEKDTNSGPSVNRMYFSTDYVVYYGQELTVDAVVELDTFPYDTCEM